MEWIAYLAHTSTLLLVNAWLAAVSSAVFLAVHLTGGKAKRVGGLALLSLSYGTFAAGFFLLVVAVAQEHNDALTLIGNLTLDIATVLTLVAVNAYLRRPLLP